MLKVGFARVDVTPHLGSPISGYFRKRLANGVLDPIELNAVVFSDGERTAAIVASDIIGIDMVNSDKIRSRVSEAAGIPADSVMICCLHQHTSIEIGFSDTDNEMTDPVYLEMLFRKYGDVVKMAMADMSDAIASTAEAEAISEIAFIRRYVLEDGTIATNPSRKGPKPVRRCDESDNTVRLLRFKREGKKDIAYVNFSTHPDVISGDKFSADWPGFVRRNIESDIENVHCICVVGCQGDSNHCDAFKPTIEEMFPHGKGYAHSSYMGRVISDTVLNIWDKTVDHEDGTVFGGVEVIYNKTNTEGEEKYDECKQFVDDYYAGRHATVPHITGIAYALRIVELRRSPIYRPVPVTVLGMGDIAFVGFGGEPFTHFAIASREAAGENKTVFCSCCTNGNQGYLPHARAFAEGGYEASGSLFTSNVEEQCIAAAKKLLDQF